MKLIKLLVPTLIIFFLGMWIGYVIGFREKVSSEKKNLFLNLSLHVSDYNLLKSGKADFVEERLGVYIRGEIMAYDYYQKNDPYSASETEILSRYVEKGRVIAQEEEKKNPATSVTPAGL